MKKKLQIIAKTPLFSGLPEDQLNDIVKICVEKKYEKKEMIFFEGDDGIGFFIVASGKVKIYKVSFEGKEQILHIFGMGEPFGEVPVFSGAPFPANAQAINKTTLLFFPRSEFTRLITSNPSLALNMLSVLSMRLREFTVQIENLSLKEVPARLASYLIHISEEQGTLDRVILNIAKGQLAGILGTIPETLSRMFAKMSTQNMIEVNGRNIIFIDREALVSLADYGKIVE
ncbi:Crp/Fnr family transcriptional regulator [Desulfobacterales bacterium HSG16]|nr:Crp/Fnr family transcriptional regulator [Desulfobacterales bacterium HSG16]